MDSASSTDSVTRFGEAQSTAASSRLRRLANGFLDRAK
jgi:hypothetical protein